MTAFESMTTSERQQLYMLIAYTVSNYTRAKDGQRKIPNLHPMYLFVREELEPRLLAHLLPQKENVPAVTGQDKEKNNGQ